MSEPVFVVVGHVNRGKSSVVSTLAADDSVRIDAMPGTTMENRRFTLRVYDQPLYTLIDTPGFERARHVLAWLKQRESSTAERAELVRRFVQQHEASGEYPQEVRLLKPIVEGGAIVYVIDGSVPFSPSAEAEMEVLRWTGQPRMALINSIGDGDHTEEWRRVLDQYFSLVRSFNAHRADFHQRLRMLEAMREVSDAWHAPMDAAVHALREDRRRRLRESAAAMAEMFADMLTRVDELRLHQDESVEAKREELRGAYYENLRQREKRFRDVLRDIYRHYELKIEDAHEAAAVEDDLFRTSTWTQLGLSRTQLAATATAAGAAAGAWVDLHTLGHSFMAGAILGGAAGLAASLYGWDQLAKVKVLGAPMAGKLLQIGPMKNANFPWVVLDRALIYHDLVSQRPHARRDTVTLPVAAESSAGGERVRDLPADQRKAIEVCFAKLRKRPVLDSRDEIRRRLTQELDDLLTARDDRR